MLVSGRGIGRAGSERERVAGRIRVMMQFPGSCPICAAALQVHEAAAMVLWNCVRAVPSRLQVLASGDWTGLGGRFLCRFLQVLASGE